MECHSYYSSGRSSFVLAFGLGCFRLKHEPLGLINWHLVLITYFKIMCVYECKRAPESRCLQRVETPYSLELEIQAVVKLPWVLGSDRGSFERTVCTGKH